MKRKILYATIITILILCVTIPVGVRLTCPGVSKSLWEYFYLDFVWDNHLDECQRKGELIIAALEKYRDDHGHYPETLEKIVPDYMDEIPKLPDHNHWSYRCGEKKNSLD